MSQDQPHTIRPFHGLAADYSCFRPSYPEQAIEAMLRGLSSPPKVADVGCGTGIGTRLLARRGAQVVGIEPDVDMLGQARRLGGTPSSVIEYSQGTAEQTGLSDSSVDLVVCAQSFHWFDTEKALDEFHRILRPEGRLALMWNKTDQLDRFTCGFLAVSRAAQEAAEQDGKTVHRSRGFDLKPDQRFKNVRQFSYPFVQGCDEQQLLGRAHSASYFPRSGELRQELELRLKELFAEFQRSGKVNLVYRTYLWLADRA